MTAIDQYKQEIIAAAKFLEENPNWEPDSSLMSEINRLSPDKAIGYIVEELKFFRLTHLKIIQQ